MKRAACCRPRKRQLFSWSTSTRQLFFTGQPSTLSSRGDLGGKGTTMFKHSCHFLPPVDRISLGETIPAIFMFYDLYGPYSRKSFEMNKKGWKTAEKIFWPAFGCAAPESWSKYTTHSELLFYLGTRLVKAEFQTEVLGLINKKGRTELGTLEVLFSTIPFSYINATRQAVFQELFDIKILNFVTHKQNSLLRKGFST